VNFREWLNLTEDAGHPAAHQLLYPPAYSAVSLYPPCDVIKWGADAITYMPKKFLRYKFRWGKGMLAKPPGYSEPEEPTF
jgi:hypothetical protein